MKKIVEIPSFMSYRHAKSLMHAVRKSARMFGEIDSVMIHVRGRQFFDHVADDYVFISDESHISLSFYEDLDKSTLDLALESISLMAKIEAGEVKKSGQFYKLIFYPPKEKIVVDIFTEEEVEELKGVFEKEEYVFISLVKAIPTSILDELRDLHEKALLEGERFSTFTPDMPSSSEAIIFYGIPSHVKRIIKELEKLGYELIYKDNSNVVVLPKS